MPYSKALKRCRKACDESWHHAIPMMSTVTHDPKRYNWGDVETLFGDQVKVVPFKPGHDASKTNKSKARRMKTKLKRLGKAKTGVKQQKAPKLSFKLLKHSLMKRLLRKIIKKKRLLRRSSE